MPIRVCKLCLLSKPLQDSHLIPAAAYAHLRDPATGKNPAFVHWNPNSQKHKMLATSRQVHDFVLCHACEKLLNTCGENWVLQKLAVGYASPLFYALEGLSPIFRAPGFVVYPTIRNPEFDTDKVVHFALGVFYKAAVHSWLVDDKSQRRLKLEFGPYEEAIRLHLIGEAAFPAQCALAFCLLAPTKSPKRLYNPIEWAPDQCRTFSFSMIGLEFWLSLGERIPQILLSLCFATNLDRPVIVNNHTDSVMDDRVKEVLRSGGAKGKLARNLTSPG
jgi:hypothetical protein